MEKNIAKCDLCNKEFSKVAYRNRHVKNVHMKNIEDGPKVKYTCDLCDKQYNQKYNLQRHITAIHLPESQTYFTCKTCNYKTLHKFNLQRHLKKAHKKSKVVDYFRPHKCTLCGKQYKHLHRLRYHERKSHNTGSPARTYNANRKCPLCTFNAHGKNAEQDINKHFESVHDIIVEIEKHYFSSMDGFFEWKKGTEKKTVSFFKQTYKSPKTMVYRCHRCGVYRSRGSNKRHLKIMGSCKIGGFCPAMIRVKIMKDESVDVYYTSKHIGHKLELKHIHLTKEERNQIATQLASKVPHDGILKGIRSSLSNNYLKRIHLMNKTFNNFDDTQSILMIDALKEEKNRIKLMLLDELSCTKENGLSPENRKIELLKEFKLILDDNSVETEEEFQFVKTHLKQLIPTLKAMKSSSARPLQIKCDKADFPANTNIKKQKKFLITKKKKEAGVNKITREETQKLALNLMIPKTDLSL